MDDLIRDALEGAATVRFHHTYRYPSRHMVLLLRHRMLTMLRELPEDMAVGELRELMEDLTL